MPFDPSLPAPNSPLHSAVIRGQFNGLKELLDSVSGVTSAVVDSVTTLPSGDLASVSVSVVGTELHLSFSLPQGAEGAAGSTGATGADGPPGPPFANTVVDSVTTLNPGEPATVGVTFDGVNVRFTFSIPRGADGATGATGLPGEVSQLDLNNGLQNTLAQTSNNSNAVSTLGLSVSDPPSQGELQSVANKLDELIQALRR